MNNQETKDFDKFIQEHIDVIKAITPINPTISKEDEWNDPEYDEYYEKMLKKRLNNNE